MKISSPGSFEAASMIRRPCAASASTVKVEKKSELAKMAHAPLTALRTSVSESREHSTTSAPWDASLCAAGEEGFRVRARTAYFPSLASWPTIERPWSPVAVKTTSFLGVDPMIVD